jgi:hypothetical protein
MDMGLGPQGVRPGGAQTACFGLSTMGRSGVTSNGSAQCRTNRSRAYSTEVALTASQPSRIMAAVWLGLKSCVCLTAEAW